jgi:single-strand DNA-binding protein
MAGDTTLTVVGNLVSDPELRFTQSGTPVANFRVASTPRHFDKTSETWVDGEPLFLSCTVWREAAEHVAESLTRGARVVVVGTLRARTWEKDGEKRTSHEIDVEEVGPSLRFVSVKVERRSLSAVASDSTSTGVRATA